VTAAKPIDRDPDTSPWTFPVDIPPQIYPQTFPFVSDIPISDTCPSDIPSDIPRRHSPSDIPSDIPIRFRHSHLRHSPSETFPQTFPVFSLRYTLRHSHSSPTFPSQIQPFRDIPSDIPRIPPQIYPETFPFVSDIPISDTALQRHSLRHSSL